MRTKRISIIALFVAMCAAFTMLFVTTAKVAKADPATFAFEEGAYVKLNGDGGLRFRLKMDEDTANEIKGNANETLYFYVASATRMEEVTTGAGAKALFTAGNAWEVEVDKDKIYAGKDELGADDGYFYANVLIDANNIGADDAAKLAYRTTDFVAAATVYNSSSTSYTSFVKSVERSMQDTASAGALRGGYYGQIVTGVGAPYSWLGTSANYAIVAANAADYTALATALSANADLYFYLNDVVDSSNLRDTYANGGISQYTVKYQNWNGTELQSSTVNYGAATPAYVGDTPTRSEVLACTFTFNDWDETPAATVTEDATYTATFTENVKDKAAIPYYMYSVGEYTNGSYYDWGAGVVAMVQNQTSGYFSLEFAGEHWARLKEVASDYGYTTIVLNIDTANSSGPVSHDDSGANCLKWTGSVERHINAFSTYADKDKLVVLVQNTAWDAVGTPCYAFYVTLERYCVAGDDQDVIIGDTLDFDDLNVSVTGSSGAIGGLTYEDFTITSLNPEKVTYSDGVFTAVAEGTATIRIAYGAISNYVEIDVLGASYIVPFSMYSVGEYTEGTYGDWGGGLVYMIQKYWQWGYQYSLEIAGENWTTLKALAAKFGYTKIVLNIDTVNSSGALSHDDSGANCLKWNGGTSGFQYDRHINDFTTYADKDKVVVIVQNTYYEAAGQPLYAFYVTLEKYGVTGDGQEVMVGDTFDFDDLNVAVTGSAGAIGGLTYEDFTITSLNSGIVSYADGEFTAVAAGSTKISVDYHGCKAYIDVTVSNGSYVVPLEYYDKTGGTISDGGGCVCFIPASTYDYVVIGGDEWAAVKAVAEARGLTKIVLQVYDEWYFEYGSAAGCLVVTGDHVGRHENAYSDFSGNDSLIVVIGNVAGRSTYFNVILEP